MSITDTRVTEYRSSQVGLSRVLALSSLVAAVGFVATLIVAGVIDPGYSQQSEAISALASTESEAAGLMIVGFVLLGAVALASGAALLGTLRGKAGKAAAILVLLSGLLTVACGFARQSCSTLQQSCLDRESADAVSGSHTLHNLMALPLFAFLVAAGFLIASALHRDPRFRHLARRARVAAVATTVSFVWFGSQAFGDNGGLVQRLMVLLAFEVPTVVAVIATIGPRPSSTAELA